MAKINVHNLPWEGVLLSFAEHFVSAKELVP